jgi:hypothetical protein
VGRGKRYLSTSNKATDAVLGGWRVGGIVNVQGGFPYSVYAQDPLGLLDVIFGTGNRANQIGDPNPSGFNKSTAAWFDKAAFAQPAVAHYGTTGRNIYRGPGFSNVDINLAKTFSITERAHLEFRAEAFNTFNHPQYGLPDTAMADPTYGRLTYLRHNPRELQLGLKLLF